MKPKYDREADILSFKLSKKEYEYATQEGDVIVHYSRNNEPVLIEITNAAKFLARTNIPDPYAKRHNIQGA